MSFTHLLIAPMATQPLHPDLPTNCFVYIPERGPGRYIAAIKRGEPGCYATTYDTRDPTDAQNLVALLNRRLGVTPEQAECMLVGSMFGWHVPGATPPRAAIRHQRTGYAQTG
ncbi:MAG: hypothetical protein OEL20_04870 [Sulfuritalea sp.]|nr:hypothetical protein [Sulfuritalea sp.]